MTLNILRWRKLAGVSTFLSLVTCYGTLILISLLGTLGVVLAINELIWAGAIVAFAVVAVIGLGFGFAGHRKPAPILIGVSGAAIIIYVMFIQYDRIVEISGFIMLALAALLDWRVKTAGNR